MVKNLPTAIVLSVAIVAIAATLIAGFAFDVDWQTVATALGLESVGGFLGLAAMKGLFHDDGAPERTRDKRRGDAS